MPTLNIPLDAGSYESDSLPISNQQCVNLFVNVPQTQSALSTSNLFGGAGIKQVSTTQVIGETKKINRGSHVKNGKPYFLNGTDLYRVDKSFDTEGQAAFTNVLLGSIPGEDRVSMADNGTQLMVLVKGGEGYIIDESAGTEFQQITDLSFKANGNPQIVTFVDGFFVCSTDSKKFIRSNANNGNSWDALAVFSAESDPDDIVGLQVYNNRLFVMGSEVSEEFLNNGGQFQRTGLFIDKGLYAPFSIITTNNSFMWLGGGTNESAAIWVLNGSTPQKVSTSAIDSIIQSFNEEEIVSSFAYSYAKKGAYFVGFSFPTRTLEFNTVTGKWNERTSQVVNDKGITETVRWRVNSLVAAYGLVLCGDSQDGRIGSVDTDIYSEYDNEIIRTFTTQPFSDLGNSIAVSKVEMTMESGVGDLETVEPKIRMSSSINGKTFNNELTRSIGKVGEYDKRCIWYKIGRFPRLAVFKFVMSDKVKPVFIKLEISMRGGQSGN